MEVLGQRFFNSAEATVASSRTPLLPEASAVMSLVLLTLRVGPRSVPPTVVPASASYSVNGTIAPRPEGNVGFPVGSVVLPPEPPPPLVLPPVPAVLEVPPVFVTPPAVPPAVMVAPPAALPLVPVTPPPPAPDGSFPPLPV